MAQKSTDLALDPPQGLTGEQQACAAWVLATIADDYAAERPEVPVDLLGFPIRLGVTAYELVGRSCHGGAPAIARCAHSAAGEISDGLTRGELSLRLRAVAKSLGCRWGADGRPLLPPIPGPRRSGVRR